MSERLQELKAETRREYWVVDVEGKRIVVYREPAAKGYVRKLEFSAPNAISPQAFPDVEANPVRSLTARG